MSVNRVEYVMYGIKFNPKSVLPPNDDKAYDKYSPLMDNAYKEDYDSQKIAIVYDGMSGGYFIVGYILAKGSQESGMKMRSISVDNDLDFRFFDDIEKICPELLKKFDEIDEMENAQVGTWAFSHWH